jgi:MFS superfamily sulfate permease-like transporter
LGGTLLLNVGYDLTWEALVDSYFTFDTVEYVSVVVITVVITLYGMTEGLVVCAISAAATFVIQSAINSNAAGEQGSGKETNAKAKKDWKIEFPILLDESGDTGRAYGATNTPHCFVIGADGKIAYMGAIDDDAGGKVGKTNYVSKAVDELLAGKPVTTSSTKAYGCGVKYGKKK